MSESERLAKALGSIKAIPASIVRKAKEGYFSESSGHMAEPHLTLILALEVIRALPNTGFISTRRIGKLISRMESGEFK